MSVTKEKFRQYVESATKFEGFMSPQHILTFLAFLDDQQERKIKGDVLEFGVYKGRSAAVLLNNISKGEKAYFVDSSTHPEVEKLQEINKNFSLIKSKSEDLIRSSNSSLPQDGLRFSHHDASHTYDNLFTELTYIENSCVEDPIIVLDDFGSWAYPQVQAAAYSYLYNQKTDFEIFMIANTKAYLCRKQHFKYYESFVLNKLQPLLKSFDFEYQIARTDLGDFRGFSMREKSSPSLPDRYGENIWGDTFYRLEP